MKSSTRSADTSIHLCLNERHAGKDAADREAIIESLKRLLKKGPKALLGNKGYRRYLKLEQDSARIDPKKINVEARFDGKWVLVTNTDLAADRVSLKYKELWRVESVPGMSNPFWRPDLLIIRTMRASPIMCFAAFLPLCFEKSSTSAWLKTSTGLNGPTSSRTSKPARASCSSTTTASPRPAPPWSRTDAS